MVITTKTELSANNKAAPKSSKSRKKTDRMPTRLKKYMQALKEQDNEMVHYFFLALLRIALVLLPQTGYVHPDEFFQTVEVVAGELGVSMSILSFLFFSFLFFFKVTSSDLKSTNRGNSIEPFPFEVQLCHSSTSGCHSMCFTCCVDTCTFSLTSTCDPATGCWWFHD